MNKRITLTIIVLIILTIPSLALQQTTGPLSINATVGSQIFTQYGLRNEENQSVTVKLSVNGSIENFINYPTQLTLAPNEFKYVNISTNISSDYDGPTNLNGTIYALKEGESGGQVQLNIRLGKLISLNIIKPTSNNNYIIITFISLIVAITILAMIKYKKR